MEDDHQRKEFALLLLLFLKYLNDSDILKIISHIFA